MANLFSPVAAVQPRTCARARARARFRMHVHLRFHAVSVAPGHVQEPPEFYNEGPAQKDENKL